MEGERKGKGKIWGKGEDRRHNDGNSIPYITLCNVKFPSHTNSGLIIEERKKERKQDKKGRERAYQCDSIPYINLCMRCYLVTSLCGDKLISHARANFKHANLRKRTAHKARKHVSRAFGMPRFSPTPALHTLPHLSLLLYHCSAMLTTNTIQRAIRSTQHATRNTQHATRNTQHATRNTQHAHIFKQPFIDHIPIGTFINLVLCTIDLTSALLTSHFSLPLPPSSPFPSSVFKISFVVTKFYNGTS
jgi:hypothetical protein